MAALVGGSFRFGRCVFVKLCGSNLGEPERHIDFEQPWTDLEYNIISSK